MKPLKPIGAALLAVLAMSATVASGAQAETAPFFSIQGTRLAEGKTHNIEAHQFGTHNFELSTPEAGSKITCKEMVTEKAVLLGSNEGNPGKDNETSHFSSCKLAEGNGFPECELANEKGEKTTVIVTNPLKSEQVENVEAGHGGKKLYEEFFPASGSFFVLMHYIGTGCINKESGLSGQIVGESRTDNSAEESIELGQAKKEATSWLIRFPATPIREVWLISGGTGKVVKTTFLSFGDTSILTGTILALLANSKFECENVLWSPLP